MSNSVPNYLAGNFSLGSWEPTQIFSGEFQISTDGEEVGSSFEQYQVIARSTAGKLVAHDPTSSDEGTKKAIGVSAATGVVGSFCPYYFSGVLNPDAVIWHISLATLADKRSAFVGTSIHISTLY